MRNLVVAIVLSVFAIVLAFSAKVPVPQSTVNPVAITQARSAITELPLPVEVKDAYVARIGSTPAANLPYLVEEARRAVDSPMAVNSTKKYAMDIK